MVLCIGYIFAAFLIKFVIVAKNYTFLPKQKLYSTLT